MFLSTTMRKLRLLIIAILALVGGGNLLMAQELDYGVGFVTLFDNTEYAGMEHQWSETLFSSRLTPKVKLGWEDGNELVVASDFTRDFGHDTDFVSDANIQFYYGYSAPQVRLLAGIFPRTQMRGLQGDLFFDHSYRFYNNTLSGVLARKESLSKSSFIEFAMDYNGKRTETTREAFAIMSAGRYAEHALYLGYDLMIGHYAKDYDLTTRDGVVDNFLLTPYLGLQGKSYDVGVKYVQSVQRDRVNENEWVCPKGLEFYASLKFNRFTLSNVTYLGEAPFVYYERYADNKQQRLYPGLQHYASSSECFYEALTLGYREYFANKSVMLDIGITVEGDGVAWGTRQWLCVSVVLDSLKGKMK